MDMDTIKADTKAVRNRVRRSAEDLKKSAAAEASRRGGDIVVALDRAQHTVTDLGDRAYAGGRQAVVRAAREIEARPWTTAFLVGGAVLAGVSFYLMANSRRR